MARADALRRGLVHSRAERLVRGLVRVELDLRGRWMRREGACSCVQSNRSPQAVTHSKSATVCAHVMYFDKLRLVEQLRY